jgi:hypothetical protein
MPPASAFWFFPMSDREHIPTRADVEMKLLDLIDGRCSRDEVSTWAEIWVVRDFDEDLIDDLVVLKALERLSGLDPTDEEDVYHEEDFRAWLHALQQAT